MRIILMPISMFTMLTMRIIAYAYVCAYYDYANYAGYDYAYVYAYYVYYA